MGFLNPALHEAEDRDYSEWLRGLHETVDGAYTTRLTTLEPCGSCSLLYLSRRSISYFSGSNMPSGTQGNLVGYLISASRWRSVLFNGPGRRG